MELLFDRFAQSAFVAAILLRVTQLFGMSPALINGLAAISVAGSVVYLLYRLWRAEGVLDMLIPGLVAAVGVSTLMAA